MAVSRVLLGLLLDPSILRHLHRQAFDLQILPTLEEAGKRILADMHLSLVHELKESLHVLSRSGFQDDVARAHMAWGC